MEGEEVRFSGPADARGRNIEMVFQDLSLCDHIDVVGNLFLGRELSRGPFLDTRTMLSEARKMLDSLEIRIPRLTGKVAQLSGGQRQAIAIARAASFKPKVLIMPRRSRSSSTPQGSAFGKSSNSSSRSTTRARATARVMMLA